MLALNETAEVIEWEGIDVDLAPELAQALGQRCYKGTDHGLRPVVELDRHY